MNNTSGGGTGGGREQQQHARGNQQATTKVGSGDNGVPFTKFSSKQSKTSTVTITGTCYNCLLKSVRFLIRSLVFVFSVISLLSDDDED